MADKEIEIGMKTTGADTAAREIDKVPDAIVEIPKVVPKAVDAINEIPKAIDEIPKVVPKAVDAVDKMDGSLEKVEKSSRASSESLKRVEKATKELALLGKAEFLVKLTSGLKDAAAAGGNFEKELAPFKDAIDAAATASTGLSTALATFATTGNPFAAISAGVVAMSGDVIKAYGDMVAAQKAAENAEKAAGEQQLLLLKTIEFRKRNLNAITQVENISSENEELAKQQGQLERLIALRASLASGAVADAQREVELTRLKGGDVALAEANAIAVQLDAEIQGLSDNLRAAKEKANQLTKNERDARRELVLLEDQLQAGLIQQEDEQLKTAQETLKAASDAAEIGRQTLDGVIARFQQDREAAVERAEIALEQKEAEFSGKTTEAAAAAFQSVFDKLSEALNAGPTQAIQQINVAAGAVTDAANTQAAQVRAAVDTERTGTVQAIQGLAPRAQDGAAIAGAVQAVGKAQADRDNAIIAALAAVQVGLSGVVTKIAAQQAQINQIFGRLR